MRVDAGSRSGWVETHNLPCYSNTFLVYRDDTVAFDKTYALHDTDRKQRALALTAVGIPCAIPVGRARERF